MSKHGKNAFLTLLCALAFVFFPVFAFASSTNATTSKPYDLVRVFYYQEGDLAYKSFLKNMKSIDVLAPQTYFFDGSGNLKGKVKDTVISLAEKNNIKIMPLVTNGSFGQKSLQAILDDKNIQASAIQALVKEAQINKYWGWQVDFEQMDLSYKDKFSDFIRALGVELHNNNLKLSVAVVAQVSDKPEDYPNTLWQDLIGVYDLQQLSPSTDFVSVMSYDDPGSKGPVARYSWLKKVLDYSLKFIPNEKLSLGIPLYYWKWDDARGKIVDIGGYKSLQKTIDTNKIVRGYSETEQAPYIQYKKNKKKYTIWYENAKSIEKKLELITKNQLYGFSAWSLGLEVPDIHRVIKD